VNNDRHREQSLATDPRWGCLLRRRICSSRSLARNSRSSNVCTLALAERVCGATDRRDPPGMFGPYRGDRRAAPAPYPQMLHGVLQRGAHASIIGQGCAHLEGYPACRAHRSATCAWWTAPSVRADLICVRDSQTTLADSVNYYSCMIFALLCQRLNHSYATFLFYSRRCETPDP